MIFPFHFFREGYLIEGATPETGFWGSMGLFERNFEAS